MLWLLSGSSWFTCWISFALVFSFMFCWVLIVAILICMFLRSYIEKLGVFHTNQTSICLDPPHELRVRLGPLNLFKPSSKIFYWPFKDCISLWIICVLCVLCFSCFRVCSLLPCSHLLGKGWPLGSCWRCLLYFCYFPLWYPGSGVVLECVVSWSLLSFLLSWSVSVCDFSLRWCIA